MSHRSRELTVRGLSRVEGEGALRVRVRDGRVERAELRIYEPPRFFEAFLRGRQYTEATDITSRICGICPVAYQASAWMPPAVAQAPMVTSFRDCARMSRIRSASWGVLTEPSTSERS